MNESEVPVELINIGGGKFKFIDLFAGLGGFHVAMERLGGECVFASELQSVLQKLYRTNFGENGFELHGDIHEVKTSSIPSHDVLCAGFPCQPFSQAGKRYGLDDPTNGNHFFKILDILDFHKPSLFILENVPNLRGHDGGRTWEVIHESLKVNYEVQSGVLSPTQFGIPQHRKRFYVVGVLKSTQGFAGWQFPNPEVSDTNVRDILVDSTDVSRTAVRPDTLHQIKVWEEFAAYFEDIGIPRFPIWACEFGATYDFEGESPLAQGLDILVEKRGAFGRKIDSFSDLPRYAIRNDAPFPKWKTDYIRRNRALWAEHKSWLSGWVEQVKGFDHSHQKFEWNAGTAPSTFKDKIIQFRPSGIRVKRGTASPALVLTKTQVPIVWDGLAHTYRYITPREGANLQSFPNEFTLPDASHEAYRALGNAVNAKVIEEIISSLSDKLYRAI